MLNIKKYLLMLSLILLSQFVSGQQVLSLDSVLNIIKRNNPELKMYEQQAKSQDALVSGASAWTAPTVGIGTFMTPYNNFSRAGNQQDGSLMLSAEQKIPNRSKIESSEAYLKNQSVITAQKNAESFNEIRALARSYYYGLFTENSRLTYYRKNLILLQNLKKLAEIRYTYNKAGLAQIYTLEAKIFELQNKLTAAIAKINIDKIKLNTLMYLPKETDFEIDTNFNFQQVQLVDQQILLSNSSTIKVVDAQIKSLNLENQMIATEVKPEFGIQFNHMFTYNNQMPNQFSLMGTVSLPIAPWSSKSYKSKLKANELEVEAMRYQKENVVNNLLGAIKVEQEHLMHMEMEINMYKNKIIPALQKSYEVMLLNYQENKEDLPEVLNSWKEINDTQLDYFLLLNEFYQTLTEYEKNVER